MSSLNYFRSKLADIDPKQHLIFATNDGPIGAGYHVTEFKLAKIDSIDCGGARSTWQQAQVQLLDGYGEAHMKVGRFLGIVDQAVSAMPDLGEVDLGVEFAPRNQGLRLYQVGAVQMTDTDLIVGLQEQNAVCKPTTTTEAVKAACCA